MYLWLIIATFIAALAAMGTSLRTDVTRLYVEPQAQNIVTKLYVQHRGVLKYMFNRRSSSDGTSSVNAGMVAIDGNKINGKAGYLPYGFNVDSGTSTYKTQVFCLDRFSDKLSTVPSACVPTDADDPSTAMVSNCCQAPGAAVYVITYGKIPFRWRDARTGKPSANLLGAMKDTLGYVNGLGYVTHSDDNPYKGETNCGTNNNDTKCYDTLGTSRGIVGQGTRPYYSLPKYIIDDADFKSECADEDGKPYCLIYMSSF